MRQKSLYPPEQPNAVRVSVLAPCCTFIVSWLQSGEAVKIPMAYKGVYGECEPLGMVGNLGDFNALLSKFGIKPIVRKGRK